MKLLLQRYIWPIPRLLTYSAFVVFVKYVEDRLDVRFHKEKLGERNRKYYNKDRRLWGVAWSVVLVSASPRIWPALLRRSSGREAERRESLDRTLMNSVEDV